MHAHSDQGSLPVEQMKVWHVHVRCYKCMPVTGSKSSKPVGSQSYLCLLSCMYLAHHKLESILIMTAIIIIIMFADCFGETRCD